LLIVLKSKMENCNEDVACRTEKKNWLCDNQEKYNLKREVVSIRYDFILGALREEIMKAPSIHVGLGNRISFAYVRIADK